MSAEIVDFPMVRLERSAGNGAREALIATALAEPHETGPHAAAWADWVLMELWIAGFKVVPVDR